ncbi:hypothetical protein PSHT_02511 [Puccinia striiformis]|uniref:Uncharacterized protein n=1 Tax=Puccinia striiformis TaxID=27350 RepID=A0A2S4WHY3_9BASI|nr:hypothetical protein PSHT_02511 [Puccinia striiformis]
MKAANIKSADFTKTADLQAQPSHLPGGQQQNPCAPGTDSSSWGHPVWWGQLETRPLSSELIQIRHCNEATLHDSEKGQKLKTWLLPQLM